MEKGKEAPILSSADLVSLPEEVFYGYIFNNSEYGDLLRLRRSCKPIKIYADNFIRNNFKSNVREINETNYTLQHFLQANLPTCSIFINNSSPAFFEDPYIPQFLCLYGDQITHLRIHHFGTFVFSSELHFFSSLSNLLHLDLDFIDATNRDCVSMSTRKNPSGTKHRVRREKSPFPENFKKLKTLKINAIQGSHESDFGYAWDFIEFCENDLEYIKHPYFTIEDWDMSEYHPKGPFGCVSDYIRKRHENNPNQPNLKFYDLEHQNEGGGYFGKKLGNLVELCWRRNVKLLNVNSNLLSEVDLHLTKMYPLAMPLVSLRNVHEHTFGAELPNLEKLVVESTRGSSFAESYMWSRQSDEDDDDDDDNSDEEEELVEMPKWPNLKILDLTIDSDLMFDSVHGYSEKTYEFLKFLFETGSWGSRANVKELALRFNLEKMFSQPIDDFPIPRVKDVTGTCPFVTKLTLQGWIGTNKEITLFWKGLPLLEEVVLEKCFQLENVAFVGEEWEDPVFLKLKHLKKLSLRRMDLMPEITDLAFNLVLI